MIQLAKRMESVTSFLIFSIAPIVDGAVLTNTSITMANGALFTVRLTELPIAHGRSLDQTVH